MSTGYVIPVDPAELANRLYVDPFNEEPEEDIDDDDEVKNLIKHGGYADLAPLLERIPEREADLIELYYIKRKRQADIAAIFQVTQAAISYRLDRGLKRIKFLLSIPNLTEEDLRSTLPKVLRPIDVDILVGMWQTTCQSEVAKQLNLTQGRVRHRFFKAVKLLESASEKDPQFTPAYKVFKAISNKGFNIVRAVVLPQWSNRGLDAIT